MKLVATHALLIDPVRDALTLLPRAQTPAPARAAVAGFPAGCLRDGDTPLPVVCRDPGLRPTLLLALAPRRRTATLGVPRCRSRAGLVPRVRVFLHRLRAAHRGLDPMPSMTVPGATYGWEAIPPRPFILDRSSPVSIGPSRAHPPPPRGQARRRRARRAHPPPWQRRSISGPHRPCVRIWGSARQRKNFLTTRAGPFLSSSLRRHTSNR